MSYCAISMSHTSLMLTVVLKSEPEYTSVGASIQTVTGGAVAVGVGVGGIMISSSTGRQSSRIRIIIRIMVKMIKPMRP